VELCLHFPIYLQNEEVIINSELRFGKDASLVFQVVLQVSSMEVPKENRDGIAILCFNEGCPVVLF
jgi:hypothetical protein